MSSKYTNQDVADVLLKARDLMNNRGKHWIKGNFRRKVDGEYCYCSVGAINAVTRSEVLRKWAYIALAEVIPDDAFWGRGLLRKIAHWNDASERRWRDVSSAFKKAAKQVLSQ